LAGFTSRWMIDLVCKESRPLQCMERKGMMQCVDQKGGESGLMMGVLAGWAGQACSGAWLKADAALAKLYALAMCQVWIYQVWWDPCITQSQHQ